MSFRAVKPKSDGHFRDPIVSRWINHLSLSVIDIFLEERDMTAGCKLLREKCRAGPQSYCLVKCFAFNLCSIVTLSLHVSKKIFPPK